jgi:hypothetical protein
MITNKKTFLIGMALLISFAMVYALIMSPLYGNGRNGLQYADDTFNSLSKGSAYFIQEEIQKTDKVNGTVINVSLTAPTPSEAQLWAGIYAKAGAQASVVGSDVAIKGDLGVILKAVLADCDAMYLNDGHIVSAKYGTDERAAFYGVYTSLKSMSKAFEKQEMFALSATVQSVLQKAVEPAYNYYGIEVKKVADYKGTVFFLMLFYLVYTIWFGFGIFFVFDGVGITTTKAAKRAEA